jgi:two-component system, NtrC family, sensor kinase
VTSPTRDSEAVALRAQLDALREVLRAISASAVDLQRVLDIVVERMSKLCHADIGMIYLPAGEGAFRAVAAYAMSPEHTEYELSHPTPVTPGTMVGRVVLSGGPVQIEDAATDPTYTWAEGRQIGGFRTILGVPIRKEARLIGTVGLARMEVRLFSREEIELVHTFADQAAIVIDNVRLFTELQEKNSALTAAHAQISEALKQQTATSEILRVIASSPTDLQPVMQAIVESAARVCGAMDSAIYRLEGEAPDGASWSAAHSVNGRRCHPGCAWHRKRPDSARSADAPRRGYPGDGD